MSKIKIFNDPIYGLVSFPYEFIYTLIDHPFFQRLRRIQQLGMSSIVYPGATHSRFHHALGALHLCDRLITNLKLKGVDITDEEHEATLIAILLHDVGHGPYSHALEGEIIHVHHEELTIQIMNRLNVEYDGRLNMAIDIFMKRYSKKFLSEIISGQIDVDRMDYLSRDSFYTGVAEGIIGYDRIIKMMDVYDNQLVIEEKGLHSIEKFLLSRYFMYQQVYLHKTALAADHMLKVFFKEYKLEIAKGNITNARSSLYKLLDSKNNLSPENRLTHFINIDDSDVMSSIKASLAHDNPVLAYLAEGLLNRKILGIITKYKPLEKHEIDALISEGKKKAGLEEEIFVKMVNLGQETSVLYEEKDEINILTKKPEGIVTFGSLSRLKMYHNPQSLYFVTYPKEIVVKRGQ